MVTAVVPEFVQIVNQMAALNMTQKVLVSDGQSLFPEAWDGTNGLVEGVYFWAPGGIVSGGVNVQDPLAVSLFEDEYGELPSIWGVVGWDAAAVALEAVKNTCSVTDREMFREYVGNLKDFPSAGFGAINFTNPPSGDNLTPVGAVGITTGEGTFELID